MIAKLSATSSTELYHYAHRVLDVAARRMAARSDRLMRGRIDRPDATEVTTAPGQPDPSWATVWL
jgi:hypothetical protein